MSDLDLSLAGVHAAVAEFLATGDAAEATWTMPRAPGKWSPSQVVEHVARIMEESAVASTIFGTVSVADFARFQELHVRHHLRPLAGAP